MNTLITYLVIGAAGCLGAMFRYFIGQLCGRLFGPVFPIGTFIINISGSFFLGWFMTFARYRVSTISDTTKLAVAVGFTGAYTTFSTLMYESNGLLADGSNYKALFNLAGSFVIGLVAVKLGIALALRS